MTVFGLKETEVANHMRAVSPADLSKTDLFERFARAAWSSITEPGDRIAGELCQALGVRDALDSLIERATPEDIAARTDGAVSTEELAEALQRWQPRLKSQAILRSIAQAARFGVQLVTPGDADWPRMLDDLGPFGPRALWVRGRTSTLATAPRSIALVGARAATGYGEHVTMEASASLVDRGYTIISGAAYGIDGMAHRAALASSGHTIAILAGGVDRFYPSGHEALLGRIVAEGAVVSEVPCGTAPTKWRFLQRNRLIAAMSLATIVLEAGWRSGSLNTANHALTLGRPLGAVPGPVTSAASAGCHKLIRDGSAQLVTGAADMAELAPLPDADAEHPEAEANGASQSSRDASTDPTGVRVLDALSTRSTRTVDDIAQRAGLSVTDVQSALGRLELEGAVTERAAGWVKRTTRA